MNITEAVAKKIADAGPDTLERVVSTLAEEVLRKRVNALVSAYTESDNLAKKLRTLKPDQLGYDDTGAVVSQSYSKQRLEERKKVEARTARVNKAINKAVESNDFGDLFKLGDGKSEASAEVLDE